MSTAPQLPSPCSPGCQPVRHHRRLCALLVGLMVWSALSIRPAVAGPKAKLLGDLISAAIGLAAVHYGKQALAERKLENEPDLFRSCIVDLLSPPRGQNTEPSAVQQLIAYLQWNRRLGKESAEDITYSALLDLCLRHSARPYDNLVAAFYKASVNRANNFYSRYMRRYIPCDNVGLLADRCERRGSYPPPDEGVRLRSQIDVARRVWCSLPAEDQELLMERALSAKDFSELGTKNGLTSRQAHDRYYNTLRQVKAQVQAACPED